MKRSRPQEFVRVEDMDAAEPIAEGDGAGVNGERGNGCVQRDPGDLRSGVGIPDACGPVEGGGDDAAAIGRECRVPNAILVTAQAGGRGRGADRPK